VDSKELSGFKGANRRPNRPARGGFPERAKNTPKSGAVLRYKRIRCLNLETPVNFQTTRQLANSLPLGFDLFFLKKPIDRLK
jgi:hypothetical protein